MIEMTSGFTWVTRRETCTADGVNVGAAVGSNLFDIGNLEGEIVLGKFCDGAIDGLADGWLRCKRVGIKVGALTEVA